jgi:tRNA threonylcarbamoyladenosine biosynthesis protein TsaB
MAAIIHIHTTLPQAEVSLSQKGVITHHFVNNNQKEHASFVHVSVKKIADDFPLIGLDAFSVTNGPGSYTGIRVGLAAAKGFCYALQKPLIALNTLQVMAASVTNITKIETDLFCPMIDARRMEVFTAVYNQQLEVVMEPCAMVLTENSYNELLINHRIAFFGDGSNKLKEVTDSANAVFILIESLAEAQATLSTKAFQNKQFSSLQTTSAYYIKEFFNG